jgi:hypothetical protein
MKRFVRKDSFVGAAAGVVGSGIMAVTQAGPVETYLITFGCMVAVLSYMSGPERVRHWREKYGRPSQRSRERA